MSGVPVEDAFDQVRDITATGVLRAPEGQP